MMISFERPLVVFDIETTGTNVSTDRIVQLSMVKYCNTKDLGVEKTILVNPGISIPKEASDIHGFTDQKVKDKPLFSKYAKSIKSFVNSCALAGFNSNRFDCPLFFREMKDSGYPLFESEFIFIDSFSIFSRQSPRNLSAAYFYYTGKKHENAHSAIHDTRVTAEILFEQLKSISENEEFTPKEPLSYMSLYGNGDGQIIDITGFLRSSESGVVFGFGKHKGRLVDEILSSDAGYIDWVIKSDFTENIKNILLFLKKEKNESF